MKIKNVSPWETEARYNGRLYVWGPEETVEVYEGGTDAVLHICSRHAHNGLVHFIFNDAMAKKYNGDHEAFERQQILNGYDSLIKGLSTAWRNEMQAQREANSASAKKGTTSDLHFMKPEKFEAKIKQVEKMKADFIASFEKTEEAPKRGRPPKKVEHGSVNA